MLNGPQDSHQSSLLNRPRTGSANPHSNLSLSDKNANITLLTRNGESVNQNVDVLANKKILNYTNLALHSTASALKLMSFASSNLSLDNSITDGLQNISDHAITAAISGQSVLGAIDTLKKGSYFATLGNIVEAFIPFGDKEKVWLRRGATQSVINTQVIDKARLEFVARNGLPAPSREGRLIDLKEPLAQAASLWWGAAVVDYVKLFEPIAAKFKNLTDLSFAFSSVGSARFQTGLLKTQPSKDTEVSFDIVDRINENVKQSINSVKDNWLEIFKKPLLAFKEFGHSLTVASTFQFIGPLISFIHLKTGSFIRMVGAMYADYVYLGAQSDDSQPTSANELALAPSA